MNAISEIALQNNLSVQESIVFTKTQELIKTANNVFKICLPEINIKFDLKGKAAGQAIRKGNEYTVRFNKELVHNNSLITIITDTIPHELAHIVCFFTLWGKNHDRNWKRICIKLGGNGERCHTEETQICGGKTTKYEYTFSSGKKIKVSSILHKG